MTDEDIEYPYGPSPDRRGGGKKKVRAGRAVPKSMKPKRSLGRKLFLAALLAVVVLAICGGVGGVLVIYHFSRDLPPIDTPEKLPAQHGDLFLFGRRPGGGRVFHRTPHRGAPGQGSPASPQRLHRPPKTPVFTPTPASTSWASSGRPFGWWKPEKRGRAPVPLPSRSAGLSF